MIKLIFLVKRRKDLTHSQFRAHYETSHTKLADEHFRDLIEGYRRNYPSSSITNPVENSSGAEASSSDNEYDAITEMWVKDQANLDEMLRRFGSPELQTVLAQDEERFMDRGSLKLMICEEVTSW